MTDKTPPQFTIENFDKLTWFVAEIISWDRDAYDDLAEKVGLFKTYDVSTEPCGEDLCYCVEEGIGWCTRLEDWIVKPEDKST